MSFSSSCSEHLSFVFTRSAIPSMSSIVCIGLSFRFATADTFIVTLPAFFMLCSLSDDKAVGGEEDRVEWEPDAEGDGLRDMARGSEMSEPSLTSKSDELNPYSRRVPVIIACSDLISGLASGMSIRFFPIFFLDNLSMSPITVQLQYLVSPLIIVWLSKRAQRLSKRLGRCQTTVFFKVRNR